MQKDFDAWNNEKKFIDMTIAGKFCHARDVWWCSLGLNIGTEENGKEKEFSRPVLVIKPMGKSCFIVPLTTSKKEHRYRIPVGLIEGRESVAVISQLRVVDSKRMTLQITRLGRDLFEVIRKSIKDML